MKQLKTIEVGTEIRVGQVVVKVLGIKLFMVERLLGNQWKPHLDIERTDEETGEVTYLSLSLNELLFYLEQ